MDANGDGGEHAYHAARSANAADSSHIISRSEAAESTTDAAR